MLVSWLFAPNVTLAKLLHPEKAPEPMLVTLSGITILVKFLQPEKAYEPMLVSWLFAPNVTLVKFLQ